MKEEFSYFEPTEALQNRIEAHKNYSTFSLEDYFANNFDFKDLNILDIGCGNGNFSGLFSNGANQYIGVEKNRESLEDAYSKFNKNKNVIFIENDMDTQLFLPEDKFDYVFFVFSVYYTNNPKELFKRVKKLLSENGKIIIVGPTINNASEIEDYCFNMFNKEKPSELRAQRIENEFLDILNEIGMKNRVEKLNFNLKFPDYEEYKKYIMSTLQYRSSYNGSFNQELSKDLVMNKYNLEITKEAIVLCSQK